MTRISPIFLGLVAATAVSGALLWAGIGPDKAWVFVFVLAGWLVTLCLHEFAHAYTAHEGGDHTVEGKGYLTLNPLHYGHPVLTLGLPILFLLVGGIPLPGGAVAIEVHRLRGRFRSLVSFAGPAVNLVFAAVLLFVVSVFGPDAIFSLSEPQAAFWSALTLMAYLQIATAILNLLPIPPLDGFGVVEPFLPGSTRASAAKVAPFGFLILLVLILVPQVQNAFSGLLRWILDVSGAPVNGVYFGFHLFQFWGGIL